MKRLVITIVLFSFLLGNSGICAEPIPVLSQYWAGKADVLLFDGIEIVSFENETIGLIVTRQDGERFVGYFSCNPKVFGGNDGVTQLKMAGNINSKGEFHISTGAWESSTNVAKLEITGSLTNLPALMRPFERDKTAPRIAIKGYWNSFWFAHDVSPEEATGTATFVMSPTINPPVE